MALRGEKLFPEILKVRQESWPPPEMRGRMVTLMDKCLIETLPNLRCDTEWYMMQSFVGLERQVVLSEYYGYFVGVNDSSSFHFATRQMGADGEQILAKTRVAHYHRSNVT